MRNVVAFLTATVMLAQQQPTGADLPVPATDSAQVQVKLPPQPATPPVVVEPSAPAGKTADVKTPQVKAPKVKTPKVKTPKVEAPGISTPTAKVPDVNAPGVNAPSVNVPTAGTPAVPSAGAKLKKPKLPGFGKPKVDRDVARIGKLKEAAIGVPAGSPLTVGVKGPDGKVEKIYGRMGDVTNEGLTIKSLRGGNLEDVKVDFKDLASMKQGPKQSKLKQLTGPVMGAMSLATLAGTVIAIVKKK